MADVFLNQRGAYLWAFLVGILLAGIAGCERPPESTAAPTVNEAETSPPAPSGQTPAEQAPAETSPAVTLQRIAAAKSIDEVTTLRRSLVDELLTKFDAFDASSQQAVEFRPHIEAFANRIYYLKDAAAQIGPQGAKPRLASDLKPRIEGIAKTLQASPQLNEEINRALSSYGILDCDSLPALLESWADG